MSEREFSTPESRSSSTPQSSVLPLLLACVAGLILMKALTPWINPKSIERPGVERGDWDLPNECLNDQISGWKKKSFVAAAQGEELSEGQYWWSHEWYYDFETLSAMVSIDQSRKFLGWHELTNCYKYVGWELTDRTIVLPAESSWPCVVGRLERENGAHAIVVFSLFYRDGQFALPPDSDEIDVHQGDLDDVWQNRLRNWRRQSKVTDTNEAIQTQVFCVQSKGFPEADVDAVIELHLGVRNALYNGWQAR